ncbi:hypothetical protein GCM10010923_17300 [Blastomonas marina]|uniref:Uncharacterized protein n=1 Tax=Blastomonas marina TaxID=1867408 RepID=A0ABQ1FFE6_9SPHN|nr:hypothetical protein GCM10010923_17300 [Blastomonas marina]
MERLDEVVRGARLAVVQRVFDPADEFGLQPVVLVEIVRHVAAIAFIGRIKQLGIAGLGHDSGLGKPRVKARRG